VINVTSTAGLLMRMWSLPARSHTSDALITTASALMAMNGASRSNTYPVHQFPPMVNLPDFRRTRKHSVNMIPAKQLHDIHLLLLAVIGLQVVILLKILPS
jgi:hypothetical protein